MRRHAKASSAASTQRQASIVRGALATRASLPSTTGSGGPSRGRTGLFLAAALAFALLALAPSASATQTRVPLGFSPIDGSSTGVTFGTVGGVGIDETTGNLFVNNQGTNVVEIFNAEGGAPAGVASPYEVSGGFNFGGFQTSGAAVDNSATSPAKGTLYVTDLANSAVKKFTFNSLTEQYEAAGELVPTGDSFNQPHSVAIDAEGNVFVGDEGSGGVEGFGGRTGKVFKFSPAGAQLARIVISGTAGLPNAIALDNAGDLFVAGEVGTYKYPANGSGAIELTGSEPTVATKIAPGSRGLALDRATNTLFTSTFNHVTEYNATTLVPGTEFAAGYIENVNGLAVNSAANRVYVVEATDRKIFAFGAVVTVPTVATAEMTAVQARSATLRGTVNPGGTAVSECKFEYGTTSAYGETAPCTGSIPTDSSVHAVSASLESLQPNTEYHFRIVAENANGPNIGDDRAFRTAKTAVTGAGVALGATAGEVGGTVYPEGAPITECRFEYGETDAYGSSMNCLESSVQIGSGTDPVAVHADLTSLLSSGTYHFRLVAKSETLPDPEQGKDATFSTRGPLIAEAGVDWGSISPTSATLTGVVNPNGGDTTYHFEYITRVQFEQSGFTDASTVPINPAAIGDGEAPLPVSQQISGLPSASTYVARLVATNSSGTKASAEFDFTTYPSESLLGACSNDFFRAAGPAGGLADCRAYEQATPLEKGGTNAGGDVGAVQASLAGDALTFGSEGYVPGTATTGTTKPHYIARRAGGAWSTASLEPPQSYGRISSVEGWAPDLSFSIGRAFEESSTEAFGFNLVYRSADGTYAPVVPSAGPGKFFLAGASEDGSKVFIEDARGSLGVAGAVTGKHNVYVWSPETGDLKLVSLLPDSACGTPPCTSSTGAIAGPYNWFGNSVANGGVEKRYLVGEMHAVSADGEELFFTTPTSGQIYLRRNPAGPAASTVQVSASQGGSGTQKPAAFMEATPDGSVAFFTSCQKLTADSNAVSTAANTCTTANQASDLYAYDVEGGTLTDLTPDPTDPRGAEVMGMVGASEDGAYVYFVANGDLDGAGPATLGDCTPTGGGICNLYLWHEGESILVARLDGSGPSQGGKEGLLEIRSDLTNWLPLMQGVQHVVTSTSRVSADGQTLLFRSQRQLTSYPNEGIPELYLYHPGDQSPTCVSCSPTGAPPNGPAMLQSLEMVQFLTAMQFRTRNLSANSERVFFETADKLLPTDTNGDNGCPVVKYSAFVGLAPACLDVYEWEANGAPGGTCHSSAHNGGCLYLISTGTSPSPSFFGDASATGDDAFFFTADPLVPQDRDEVFDAYDASVDGGLASQQLPPPPCEGEACRGRGTGAPPAAGAATASFAGPGNPKPRITCPKGRSRRKGRCVKPRHHKHKKARHHKRSHKRASANRGGGK